MELPGIVTNITNLWLLCRHRYQGKTDWCTYRNWLTVLSAIRPTWYASTSMYVSKLWALTTSGNVFSLPWKDWTTKLTDNNETRWKGAVRLVYFLPQTAAASWLKDVPHPIFRGTPRTASSLIRPYIPSGKFKAIRQSMCPSAGSTNDRTPIYSDRPACFVRCTCHWKNTNAGKASQIPDMGQEQPLCPALRQPYHTDGPHHQTSVSLRTEIYPRISYRFNKERGQSVLLVHARTRAVSKDW